MKIFLVGGAVRDKLMGFQAQDRDWLVLDSTPEEMIQKGFSKVGARFPIFLHPQTKEEYAFPRGSSLIDDLYRRDLTINSMAIDMNGNLIDPFHGQDDLKNKILRHTSEAFADDPFRVYRILRFKTRYPDFKIADETLNFLKKITSDKRFENQDPERMMKELRIVLSLSKPSIFFDGLREVGALSPFFKEFERPSDALQVLDRACELSSELKVRFAALTLRIDDSLESFCKRILAPNAWMEAALVTNKFHHQVEIIRQVGPRSVIEMFYAMDAFRKTYLVETIALVAEASRIKGHSELLKYFELVKKVSANDIDKGLTGKAIGEAIRDQRIKVLTSEYP